MPQNEPPAACPECGAIVEPGGCQAIFDRLLALEFTDPAYGDVHMLTVTCFMIQHNRYSDDALAWIEQKLRVSLEDGMPDGEIRRQAAGETSQGKRRWKVKREPDSRRLPKIAWSMTVVDVAGQYRDAASYRALVKQWARITLREMKPMLPGP